MKSKRCSRCNTSKPLSEFGVRSHAKGTYQSWCKSCHRDYNAEDYQAHKPERLVKAAKQRAEIIAWYQEMKQSIPCTDCQVYYPYYVTQYDHIGTDKLSDVSALLLSRSRTRILAEIAKCELVCANCHAIRTHQRRQA